MALLTMVELAVELGVHPNTVWRDYQRRRIPAERIGRLLRFDLPAVRQAMRRRARMGAQPEAGTGARIGDSRPRTGSRSARRPALSPPPATRARRQA